MRLVWSCLALFALACSTSGTPSVDPKPVLADVTNVVIVPALRDLDASVVALVDASAALDREPSAASLASAQSAWRSARRAWHLTDAYRFGPAKALGTASALDFAPARVETVDAAIASADPMTPAWFDALGSNAKGFTTLEYLLFEEGALAKLGAAPRRRAYAAMAARDMKVKTEALLGAWQGAFARELTEGSATYPTSKAAVDELVNGAVVAVETVVSVRIAKPYGLRSAGNPLPDQVESARSGNSIADMTSAIDGVRVLFTGGASGKGLGELVRARNPSLADRVVTTLDDARAKIEAIPGPFDRAVREERPSVETGYQAARAAKAILTVEVANTLGTTLQFNDTDGD